MLSNKGATEALLGNSKQSPIIVQPKTESLSDEIRQPSKAELKEENKPAHNSSKVPQKKGKKSKAQKNFTFVLKIFNILLGFLLTAFGAFCYYRINSQQIKSFQLIGYIMPGYIAFSGLIIIAIEMHIGFICRNMKFLYNYFGRGFFNIYVGIMPLTLLNETEGSKQTQIEKVGIYILVSLLIFIGALYIMAKICCCAKQGDKRKKKHRKSSLSSESSQSDD